MLCERLSEDLFYVYLNKMLAVCALKELLASVIILSILALK